jgi:hypothetical protein
MEELLEGVFFAGGSCSRTYKLDQCRILLEFGHLSNLQQPVVAMKGIVSVDWHFHLHMVVV